MNSLLSQTNGFAAHADRQSWLQSSVQQFFTGVNWDDHSVEVQKIKLTGTGDTPIALSLTLSVGEFFSAVQWDGATIAPVATVEVPDAAPIEDLTLDNFFDQF
jgi:hypothetical protein